MLTIHILQFDWLGEWFCLEVRHPPHRAVSEVAVVTSGELDGVAMGCCYGYFEDR